MRLLPHWPNFTPIAAIALFGGTKLNKKWLAFLVPLAAMFISNLDHWISSLYCSCLSLLCSNCYIRNIYFGKRKNNKIIFSSLISSVLFFLITNFAVWLGSPFYTQDIKQYVLKAQSRLEI